MTRSLRVQACAQWWRASGDDMKPSSGTWRECHPTFQLTKHWDYRSRHQSVDDLTAIGSAALVVLATAGLTNSVRTINADLLTYGEQPSGVVILERRYGPRRLRDDNYDDMLYIKSFRILSKMKCISYMSVQLNTLCLICINRQYPQNSIKFDNDVRVLLNFHLKYCKTRTLR